MQLYEDGKLDLHEDIRTYLPAGFQVSIKQNQEVKMLDLMNHTAGFDSGYRPNEPGSSLGNAVSRYDSFQCFEEGEVVAYSNYGANLAAFVLEEISGQSFSSYVQEHILDPLGMQSFYSDFSKVGIENGVFPEDIDPLKAKGYARESCVHEGDFQEVSWYNSGWLYASGALNGNASDLLKFANALLDDSNYVLFKDPSTLQEMLSPSYIAKEDDTLFSNYHGFWGSNGNFEGLGHAGNTYGFSTRFIISPSQSIAVVVLTNDADGEDITYGLVDLLLPKNYQQADPNTLPDAREVAGDYANTRGTFHHEKEYELLHIEATGVNEITVKSSSGRVSKYKQIQPYLYESFEDINHKIYEKNKIYFTVKDNKVVKGSKFVTTLIPVSDIDVSRWYQQGLDWVYD